MSNVSQLQVSKSQKKTEKQPISDTKYQKVLDELALEKNPCAHLTVLRGYAKNYAPVQVKTPLPKPISALYNEDLSGADIASIIQTSDLHFQAYRVSQDQAAVIEKLTRSQSGCKLWFTYRAGRITASNAFPIWKCDIKNPSKSLILQCCYPETSNVSTEATK